MKFFADTAEISEIRDLAETGLLDGVTTNPSLIHKSGRNFLEVVREIASVCPGPSKTSTSVCRPLPGRPKNPTLTGRSSSLRISLGLISRRASQK